MNPRPEECYQHFYRRSQSLCVTPPNPIDRDMAGSRRIELDHPWNVKPGWLHLD